MLRHDLPIETLAHISPNDARAYANAKGWRRQPQDVGKLAVFNHPDRALEQLLVPYDIRRVDFAERMEDAILKLAEVVIREQ